MNDGFYSLWRPWSTPVVRARGVTSAKHVRYRLTSWPMELRRVNRKMRPVR